MFLETLCDERECLRKWCGWLVQTLLFKAENPAEASRDLSGC